MFKHVLVTGGAGFIGSHLVDLLVEKGYRVRVFDNLEHQVHGNIEGPPAYLNREAEFIRGDVLDRDALAGALEGIDAVVHDAAMVGTGQSQYMIGRYVAVNTAGIANLFDIIVNEKTSVERVMVASSMSIYGEGAYRRPSDGATVCPPLRPAAQLAAHDFEMRDPETGEVLEPVPTPETKPLQCTSVYAITKRDQEDYAFLIGRTHGISAVAVRMFNVFGPRQALSNPYTGPCAIFTSRIKNGNPPIIFEDGKQLRDFTYVREMVEAKLFLLENPQAEFEAFNICSGRQISILELARLLAKLHGRPEVEPEVTFTSRSGDIRHCFGDPSKLAALGWQSRLDIEEGLAKLAEWAAGEEAVDRFERARDELARHGLIGS